MSDLPLTWLADELRAAGLPVVEVEGWKTRGAVSRTQGRKFEPIGQLWHHSADVARTGAADVADDAGLIGLITNGRGGSSPLAGPLYNVHFTRVPEVHIIAAGRANHAGRGSWPGVPKDSGNTTLVGLNLENDGLGEDYTPEQLSVALMASAVIARRLEHDAAAIAMHREYSSEGKPDPAGIEGPWWRSEVAQRLDTAAPAPRPQPSEEDVMHPVLICYHAGRKGHFLVEGSTVRPVKTPADLAIYRAQCKLEANQPERQRRWIDLSTPGADQSSLIDALERSKV